MSQDLTIDPTNYAEFIEQVAYVNMHHIVSNSKLYKFDSGVVPMFAKNFNALPEYVNGETIHRVSPLEVNRLDLISWKYYHTPELFWVIAAVNNILNLFELKEGTMLRILPLEYIEYKLLRYSEES